MRSRAPASLASARSFRKLTPAAPQWFYAPLTDAYREIHSANASGGVERVRMHSCEVHDRETGALVAGEVGYASGGVYTSLSGFHEPGTDSAGTVQLYCLGAILSKLNFRMWDLGMGMEYKFGLGAREMSREGFLSVLREARGNESCVLACDERMGCDEALRGAGGVEAGGGRARRCPKTLRRS